MSTFILGVMCYTAMNAQEGVFDITNYGIAPNSNQDAVPAIKKALSAAQSYVKQTAQTAEIYIPSGKFNISQFKLTGLNNIHFHLGTNAEIYAFPKSSSTNGIKPYITIQESKDFILYGDTGSLIDGNGATWWDKGGDRPDFLSLERCENYEVYGLTLTNPPNHTFRLSSCTNGVIHDLTITSPEGSASTDGIDPMSSIDGLEIYNCVITNNDDGFAINSNVGPMNNIHIHDCILRNGHGMSFGSAINYDITDVLIENLTLEGTQYGLRIKCAESNREQKLKNIKFVNITAKDLTRDAIRITTEYSSKPNKKVRFKNISITDFTCIGAYRALNLTITDKDQVVTPIVLNNVHITNVKKKDIIENCPLIIDGVKQ